MKWIVAAMILVAGALGPAVSAEEADAEPLKPALLVIDIQNSYLPMMDQTQQTGALRMINGTIWQFRQHGLPVIRVYHTDLQWGPEVGSEEFQFPETVIVQEEDPMIVKN